MFLDGRPAGDAFSAVDALLQVFLSQMRLQVVGRGTLLNSLSELVNRLNISQQVRFEGPQSVSGVVGFMRAADVLVNPRITGEPRLY